MCGIAGIVTRRNIVDLHCVIKEMTDRVRHRGPDDEGNYIEGKVALGHRRLSIVDLSRLGHQPMISADRRYVITFNGEIYNFQDLRSELAELGFDFRSNTDTEVILQAYATWGPECLSRFNGMWSFAIYDRVAEMIFAARDRFGVKPLYYILNDALFAFGSEIGQLVPLLDSVAANPEAVAEFVLTGAQSSSIGTFFRDVSSLSPGHHLTYDLKKDQCIIGCYYNLSERLNGVDDQRGPDAVEEFRQVLEDSVRLRLQADVRVGTCLSGGLDSSSVALLAARIRHRASCLPFSAVTAISEDPRNSEEVYAEEVVRKGALHWIRVCPRYEDFCALLPFVVRHQEEPFGSPSICMQAFVMRAANENGIVVLLDGQGGDETLLGYEKYYPAYCVALWHEGGLRRVLQGMRQIGQSNANMGHSRMAAYLFFMLFPRIRHLYYLHRSSYLAQRPALTDWTRRFGEACFDIRSLQILEVEKTTLPLLLRYEDRNSMAFSIEARLPFLDYRLVEQSISLAPSLKIQDGWTKWVLRTSMSDLLPHNIAWRRNKIGFAAPEDLWLSRHIGVMTEKIRQSPLIVRLCNLDELLRRFAALDRRSQWRLYCLAMWEEQFGVGV
jgi:asparagine synthase (glutamine-hydrolysing)